jgi:hypothetical protein
VVGADDLVDLTKFYWLPLQPFVASRFLQAHAPAGTTTTGTGSGSGPGPGSYLMVSYSLKSPPAGIDQGTMLLATLAAGPRGGTIMRADAEVVWYPPRTAAEYVNPEAYRAVTISVTLVPRSGKPRVITRTFAKRAVMASLARVLDRLRTLAPPGPLSCPAMRVGATFSVRFVPAAGRAASLTVSPWGCIGDLITVSGKAQPVLLDFQSRKLLVVVDRLLGVHRPGQYS